MTFLGNIRDKLQNRKIVRRRTTTNVQAGESSQAPDTPTSEVAGRPVKLGQEGPQLASPLEPPTEPEPIDKPSRVNRGTVGSDPDTQVPITESAGNAPIAAPRSEGMQTNDEPSPANPPAVPPPDQCLPPDAVVARLWDAAYDRIGAEDPSLLRLYDKLLSSYLEQGEGSGGEGLARGAQMNRVIHVWLDRVANREVAEVDHEEEEAPTLIPALRKTVLSASERAPHAAIAWSATCLAVEVRIPVDSTSITSTTSCLADPTDRIEGSVSPAIRRGDGTLWHPLRRL